MQRFKGKIIFPSIILDWLDWQPWGDCNCTIFQHNRFRECKWDKCNKRNETKRCTDQCPGEKFHTKNLMTMYFG